MKRHLFTLLETMIAAVILATAAAAAIGILGTARANLLRARERWQTRHLLTQATEFYLLGHSNAPVPEGLLPQGYRATCTVTAVEDIESEAQNAYKGWCLCEYTITLLAPDGTPLATDHVRKVLQEDDLP